ncbi:MAG: hypothetical protein LBM12_02285 [Candidatus Nomurabacteria bacterium]|nr:hypothetical protein [Candidatus Nomurabacteria bacterium]
MKRFGLLAGLAGVLSVVGVLGLSGQAWAEAKMTMSPGSSDAIVLEPGMVQRGSFMIYNTGDEKIDVTVTPTALCVNSTYNYTFDGCEASSGTKIKDWMTLAVDNTSLNPGDETEVEYTISVPTTDLPGGSQYAGVTVQFQSMGGSNLEAKYTLGYKIFAYNPIGAELKAELLSAKVDSLQFKRPLSARMTAKNEGNIDFFTKINMTVATMGDKEVHKSEINYVVMPGTTRELSTIWDGAPHLGLFKVKYEVVLESVDGKVIDSKVIEKTVLLMPLFMFVVILVVIAALILFAILRVRKAAELKNARRY